jgi:hypothetical protein
MSFENMSAASAEQSDYRYATFQHRLGAYALDWGLALLTLGIGWLIWSLIVWPEGQTPAKKILKLRTINVVTKQPATWGHMSIREFLIPLAVFIASGTTGGIVWGAWITVEICFYFLKGKRTLRDYWVKTVIVNES